MDHPIRAHQDADGARCSSQRRCNGDPGARPEGLFLFAGVKRGKPTGGAIGNSAMREVMMEKRPAGSEYTVHGFRSSFADWVGDCTDYDSTLADYALGHKVGGEVERAYRRGDALEKRRALMADWATYCTKTE